MIRRATSHHLLESFFALLLGLLINPVVEALPVPEGDSAIHPVV